LDFEDLETILVIVEQYFGHFLSEREDK